MWNESFYLNTPAHSIVHSRKICSLMFYTNSVGAASVAQSVLNSVERLAQSGQLKDTHEFSTRRSEHWLLMKYKGH